MSSEADPPPRRRVLLVDDEESTRNALAGWLSYEYDVATARDGVEGLEQALAQPAPDAVVADIWMPRLDGVAMVRRMKQVERLRHVPVIFLTGQTSPASVIAGISAGARAYIPKPVDLDVLDRKLRLALSR